MQNKTKGKLDLFRIIIRIAENCVAYKMDMLSLFREKDSYAIKRLPRETCMEMLSEVLKEPVSEDDQNILDLNFGTTVRSKNFVNYIEFCKELSST